MVEKGKEKITWMKLRTAVLDSDKNIKKIQKAFCSFPQIRDQTFDEITNTVTIKVVCCSPEKIMDKLCSKGRGAIKFIETIDPPKPQAQKPKEPEKPKEIENPKPEKTDSSSQQVTISQAPMMGHPIYNGPCYESAQPLLYPSRAVHNSWGGGTSDYFSDENPQGCYIM